MRDIFRMILHRSQDVATAQRFTQRIKDRCDRNGDAPYAGRPRDDLMEGLRTLAFERPTVIAYRAERKSVRIINIFYRSRDFEAVYSGDITGEAQEPRS